jgi:PASTA domain
MLARTAAVVPRYALLVVVCLFTTAAIAFAADQTTSPATSAAPAAPAAPADLTVPDLRGKAYVFAKGILEDAGFAWSVGGAVAGYAANVVSAQSPAPGTRVVDNGAPTVTLTLVRTGGYRERGAPENASPYAGTAIELPAAAAPQAEAETSPTSTDERRRPKPKKAKPKRKRGTTSQAPPRKRAFEVEGAPAEPLDEMPLPARARQLDAWVDGHAEPSEANVRHWLYQHSWLVTGARFGWSGGAEALERLIAVDRKVERLWGVGSKSRVEAEQALAHVRKKSR